MHAVAQLPLRASMPRAAARGTCTTVCELQQPVGRRQALALSAASLALVPLSASAKVPGGYSLVKDATRGYAFIYPEVALEGQDKAFKDVIEPLESVSLSILPTTRKSLADAGTPDEVAAALTQKSASATTQVAVVSANQRKDDAGNVYYFFEFTSKARGIVRHAITTLAIVNGKVFTLTTGSSERRWSKMSERLKTVSDSFSLAGY